MSHNDSRRVSRPPMAPGVLPETPFERSCGTLGVLVGALLMFVGLSWGASGRVGGALWFACAALYSHVVLVCALEELLRAFGVLLDAHGIL